MNVAHIRRFFPHYPVFGIDPSQAAQMSLSKQSVLETRPRRDQAVTVMSGALMVENESEKVELSHGDTLLMSAGIRHRFWSEADEVVLAFAPYQSDQNHLPIESNECPAELFTCEERHMADLELT